jgi:eukaryotic-like serine/threonine-protein kinase
MKGNRDTMAAGDVSTNAEKPDLRIGSYRILKPLGSGGMSSVFHAVHAETGHEVAVKVLPRSLARNPTSLSRFLREAKSVEALEHPNIVAIYDRGVDSGRHYLVLEYISGGDLHDWVRSHGAMPIPDAIRVIQAVAEGLRYAAGQGVIHRDIKPANLLMTTEGLIKITDLGLALQSVDEDERVTREGTTVGTVDYMSPEQARDSRATNIRSDIYSLGCTFYFLLTGTPPYPGGDVAEKLARHCTAPTPDPRSVRADIPEGLSRLVRKMMAKKADARYQNYDEILTALSLALKPAEDGPLDAILVDDDEDDDADDDAMVLTLAEPPAASPSKAGSRPPVHDEILLADLAELDDPAPVAQKRKVTSVPVMVPEAPPARPAAGRGSDDALQDDEESDSGEFAVTGSMPGATGGFSGRRMSEGEKSWLKTCIFLGIGLVIVVIAIDQLIRATSVTDAPAIDGMATNAETVPDSVVRKLEEGATSPANSGPVAVPRKSAIDVAKAKAEQDTPRHVAWVEPVDPPAAVVPEEVFGPDAERKARPDWAKDPISVRLPGKLSVVRRIPDSADADQKPSLRTALDVIGGGTIEVADNGPFFESDLRFGESRVIRARPGFRPIVCLTRSKNEATQHQTAFVDVGEKSLTLDGIDLIVNATELAAGHTSLFQCSGGSLNLQNCTITFVSRADRSISLVATTSPEKPSRIRIERCLLRGAFSAAIDLATGAGEVLFSRSVVFNGQGAIISGTGSASATRVLYFERTILAARGAALDFSEASRSSRSRPITIRALGTSFAHFQTAARTSLIAWRGSSPAVADIIQWQGDHNQFVGWSDMVSIGSAHQVLVSDLSSARSVWTGTDPNSLELSAPWPEPKYPEGIVPEQLQTLAANRRDILERAAAPSPFLFEKTIDQFPRIVLPQLAEDAPKPSANMTGPGAVVPYSAEYEAERLVHERRLAAARPPAGAAGRPGPASAPPAKPSSTVSASGLREIGLDAEAPPFMGDVGLFLADQVKATDRLVRLRVIGANQHVWSPFRMPDGVSLEILVIKDPAGKAPSWSAARGVRADALIEVRDASLALRNVDLSRDGSASLKALVRVERGHLVLTRCRLHGPGTVEAGGGNLIDFVARGTEPLIPPPEPVVVLAPPKPAVPKAAPPAAKGKAAAKAAPSMMPPQAPPPAAPVPIPPWPFAKFVDKPTLLAQDGVFITGGDVLSAEIGRGLVAIERSAVVAGSTAFSLVPGRVARARLDADLWLDRCTVASERTFLSLGAWPGSEPGPDRPWLVSTQNCAFFGTYERTSGTSVLLRSDAASLAHGTLFWQASGDAFEVPAFTATGQLAAATPTRRPDVARNWGEFWGEEHMHNISGPHGAGGTATSRLLARLRPGDVEAADLAIDPNYPANRRHHAIGVDLKSLGIAPSSRGGRRK